jgi:hypothetical protein
MVVVARGFFDLNAHLFHACPMSAAAPEPSMMMVFFAGLRRVGLAQISQRHFSSDMPTSSAMTLPPVRQAMSSMASAAIAEAWGLDGHHFQDTAQGALTTSVARASPSTSSAMMSNGRPASDLFQRWEQVTDVDFCRRKQDKWVIQNRGPLFRVVDEVR